MDLNKWTVIRLKDACTRRKVEVAGKKKADLVESLTTYLRGKLLMIKYAIYIEGLELKRTISTLVGFEIIEF